MKTALKWIVRLLVLCAFAYFLRPWYAPPSPTLPGVLKPEDRVSWTYFNDKNHGLRQTLILFGDGRCRVEIFRPIDDPDLPDGGGWEIQRDPQSAYIRFSKEGLLSPEKSKALLQEVFAAGLLDLQREPSSPAERIQIRSTLSGIERQVEGPLQVGQAFSWYPERWSNRLRWQKMNRLIQQDPTLRNVLARKKIILTEDDPK